MKFDILIPGEVNPDLILAGLDLQVRFGQQETLVDSLELAPGPGGRHLHSSAGHRREPGASPVTARATVQVGEGP